MIKLTEAEVKLIKMCKLHYKHKYPLKGNWSITLRPLFKEIYGWSAKDFPDDYRYTLFNKLFDTYLKIQDDGSGSNQELKGLFTTAFNRDIRRDYRRSIDRVINELCGLIQCNVVIENGNPRYNLN